MQPEELKTLVNSYSLARDVDRVPKGHLRIETGFLYPNGESVDLFLVQTAELPLRGLLLTDFGNTMGWLFDLQMKPWLSKKRKALTEETLCMYGVTLEGGALQIKLDSANQIPEAIAKLGQACIRIADLIYTRRSSLQTDFSEQVEETLADIDLPYETNAVLVGLRGVAVSVNYLVTGHHTQSAILTLTSGSTSGAHTMSNEVLRKWIDLAVPERGEQRVTLFDDSRDVYRGEDLDRLSLFSDVIPFSDKTGLTELLAA